ncbi:Mut7-C ubiquitin/RNAse domain-containing protein [Georgenia sp. EYE_87]|uniref:Mut7-C ubiquitin/RNAse domain-containing protein n=1 Tax=Georgenia sp. EYE_87 TaxID=2853448 RepID=UPI00200634D0|nr:Mut7-C ubiquitin/RNAse domain-containing protein [Georgenia sp. EYE_87]MCK6210329.1 Mut7-C ubiquitin/RNAse domain-containing protein [Georgenia sp. EYE_87]
MGATVRLLVAPELRAFLPPRSRGDGGLDVPLDPGTPLVHLVPAAGVPLTEVGALRVVDDDAQVTPEHRPSPGAMVEVGAVGRPQPAVSARFVLDVHLGALARRLRLLGLDVAYGNDAGDAELVARALGEARVLLTQDHALLRRRALAPVPAADGCPRLARAAHVRGSAVADQLDDVLNRFAPLLAPYTRCVACGGELVPASVDEVAHLLEPGTLRTYEVFVRCAGCGRPYWHGAHGRRLDALVQQALRRHA